MIRCGRIYEEKGSPKTPFLFYQRDESLEIIEWNLSKRENVVQHFLLTTDFWTTIELCLQILVRKCSKKFDSSLHTLDRFRHSSNNNFLLFCQLTLSSGSYHLSVNSGFFFWGFVQSGIVNPLDIMLIEEFNQFFTIKKILIDCESIHSGCDSNDVLLCHQGIEESISCHLVHLSLKTKDECTAPDLMRVLTYNKRQVSSDSLKVEHRFGFCCDVWKKGLDAPVGG